MEPHSLRTPDRQVTFSSHLSVSQRRLPPRARYGSAPEVGSGPPSYERSRATSGSEVGLELDPSRAKAIEVYGFIAWALSFVAWLGYLLWAFLPESALVSYPSA